MKIKNKLPRGLNPFALGLVLLFLPMAAGAFDFTLDNSREISDPSYLPLGGQLFGSTEYTNGNPGSNTNNSTGAPMAANSSQSNLFNQVFEFGFTDDFTFHVGDSFEWVTSTNTPAGGASTNFNFYGFEDPTFRATWRFMDQSESNFNWDLIGSYSPNLFTSQSASSTQNGTVARGGNSELLGTAFSQKMRSFTYYLEATMTYLDNRTSLDPTGTYTSTFNSSWQYELSLLTQTRFTDQWSLNLNLSHTFFDNVNASIANMANPPSSTTNQQGDVTEFTSALNWQAIPDRCVLSFIYSHDFDNDSAYINNTHPANSTTTTNRVDDIFSGELRYVFN
jgi:hypothetical protein